MLADTPDAWQSGVKVTGVRNPYYYEQGKPYFDSFELDLGVEPSVGILRIESGEADISLISCRTPITPAFRQTRPLTPRLLPTGGFPNTDYMI